MFKVRKSTSLNEDPDFHMTLSTALFEEKIKKKKENA